MYIVCFLNVINNCVNYLVTNFRLFIPERIVDEIGIGFISDKKVIEFNFIMLIICRMTFSRVNI